MVGEMPLPAKFFIAFVIVLALIGGVAWLVRRFGSGALGAAAARGRQARLGVIEATAVDSRRRLVLVRRDNVEHLIMLGGPTDVVVEANIVRGQPAVPMREAPAPRLEPTGRPADNGLWSTPPEPPRGRGGERPMMPMPPVAEDLPLQPEPGPRPHTADRLAGLAAEFARSAPPPIVDPRLVEPRVSEPRIPEPRMPEPRIPEPRIPEPRMSEPRMSEPRAPEARIPEPRMSSEPRIPEARIPEPRAPEPRRPADLRRPLEPRRAPPIPTAPIASPSEESSDRQLAAMAEQLEAALRRSPTTDSPTLAAPEPAPLVPPAPRARPSLRSSLEPRGGAPSSRGTPIAPRPLSPEPAPHAAIPSAAAPAEPDHAAAPTPPATEAAGQPAPVEPRPMDERPGEHAETSSADAKPADAKPAKTPYESLEEEMANLLGRAPGKP